MSPFAVFAGRLRALWVWVRRIAGWVGFAILAVMFVLMIWSKYEDAVCLEDCREAGFDGGDGYYKQCFCYDRVPLGETPKEKRP